MAKKKINASSHSSLYTNRKKHKSPTKRGKTRQRTQAQKKKENARRRQIGQSRALFELEDPNIVYYLGQEPTYIHSNEVYFKKGRIKARELLNTSLQKLVGQVQSQIIEVTTAVDKKIQSILNATGFSTFDQFAQWWETRVQPHTNIISDGEALYYLTLLEQFKTNATLISSYRYTREKYPNDVKRLVDNGFVLADFQLTPGARARKEDPITKIRENQRQIIQELASYLKTKLPTSNDVIDRAINDILNGATQNNVEKAYAFNIGQLHEYLFAQLEKWVTDGYEFVINNVAAEKHPNFGKNSKDFKADSLITMNKKSGSINISVQFYTSDKSGMRYQYGHKYDGNIKNTLDLFTASITSDTYDIFNVTSSIDMNTIDPQINNLFNYVIRNSDWFGIKDIATKDIIMSFFAWAKLIVEITGYTNNINDFVPVIRMFNRLYSTSDLLRRFQRIKGRDILSFVNKAYLTEYYNIYTFSTDELKNNLYEEKKQFLTTSGENVSYKDIKKAIFKILEQLNLAAIKRPGFATSYAIVMGNISNLK